MGCNNVCLERGKGKLWSEVGGGCLPSGSNEVKVVGKWIEF